MSPYPVPQANNVEALATVVDAVAQGADTDALVADAIGMVGRQGAYYPNAAAALGYLTDIGGSPRRWALTEAGEDFLSSEADDRARDISRRIVSWPDTEALLLDPTGATLLRQWADLSGDTPARRLASLEAWVKFAFETDPGAQTALIQGAMRETSRLTPEVVARERAKRLAAAEAAKPRTCPTCFLSIPLAAEKCQECA